MSDFNSDFGDLVKTYREKKDVSQEELGVLLETSRATILNIESGKHGVNFLMALALIEFLTIPLHEVERAFKTSSYRQSLKDLPRDIREVIERSVITNLSQKGVKNES